MPMVISITLNERIYTNARVVSYLQNRWYRHQHSYQLVDYSGVSYLFTCHWMVSNHVSRVFDYDLLSPGVHCINPAVRLCPLTLTCSFFCLFLSLLSSHYPRTL